MTQRTFFRDLWAQLGDGSLVYPYTGVSGSKKGLYSVNFTSDNAKFEGATEEQLRAYAESGRFRERGMVRMLPLEAKPSAQKNAFAPTHYKGRPLRPDKKASAERAVALQVHSHLFPDVVIDPEGLFEGATTTVHVNAFERSIAARRACLAHYGYQCRVCDLEFSQRYGPLGRGFIHVHHIRPLADIRGEYQVDPVRDLVPVCPNCHAMLHRTDPPTSVDDLRRQLLPA